MKRTLLAAAAALALGGTALGQTTFYDAAGRVTGHARTDSNGVDHFYDAAGRPAGTSRVDSNGVTHFYDASGRVAGSAEPRQ